MKLSDLDAQVVISSLGREASRCTQLAAPGSKDFPHYMAAACVLTSLAIALNDAAKIELQLEQARLKRAQEHTDETEKFPFPR